MTFGRVGVSGAFPCNDGWYRHYRPGDLATVRHEFVDRLRPGEIGDRAVFSIHDSGDGGWAIGLPTTVPAGSTVSQTVIRAYRLA